MRTRTRHWLLPVAGVIQLFSTSFRHFYQHSGFRSTLSPPLTSSLAPLRVAELVGSWAFRCRRRVARALGVRVARGYLNTCSPHCDCDLPRRIRGSYDQRRGRRHKRFTAFGARRNGCTVAALLPTCLTYDIPPPAGRTLMVASGRPFLKFSQITLTVVCSTSMWICSAGALRLGMERNVEYRTHLSLSTLPHAHCTAPHHTAHCHAGLMGGSTCPASRSPRACLHARHTPALRFLFPTSP